jgi:hypothetical protein
MGRITLIAALALLLASAAPADTCFCPPDDACEHFFCSGSMCLSSMISCDDGNPLHVRLLRPRNGMSQRPGLVLPHCDADGYSDRHSD